jgi:hypothetical protein
MRYFLIHVVSVLSLAAAGAAALYYASEFVASIALTATLLLLLIGAGLAFSCRGLARAFFVGFALFGLSYFLLRQAFETELMTTRATKWSYGLLHGKDVPPSPPGPVRVRVRDGRSLQQKTTSAVAPAPLVVVGECVWTVLLGYVGGCLAMTASPRANKSAAATIRSRDKTAAKSTVQSNGRPFS